jgi:4-oxalocrotonate tautomerase
MNKKRTDPVAPKAYLKSVFLRIPININMRRNPMPLVNVKVIEGVFSEAQKKEMVHKLTDTMIAIAGENTCKVTWVVIDELKSGNLGIGGNVITTEAVKALAAGKN